MTAPCDITKWGFPELIILTCTFFNVERAEEVKDELFKKKCISEEVIDRLETEKQLPK